jgi:enamine deaminase RidA (YjgF/YER057c/UK114 family)
MGPWGSAPRLAIGVLPSLSLGASPTGISDVVKTTVYVASNDRADLVAAWDVVRRHFGRHDAPGTLVGVTMLGCCRLGR